MKRTGFFKIFTAYLKDNLKLFLIIFLSVIILSVVLFLNHLPVAPAAYALLLCAVAAVIILAAGFYSYYKKFRGLEQSFYNISCSDGCLPEAKSLTDRKYCEIISYLYDENRRLTSDFNKEKAEMLDYYTMWTHQIKTPIAAMRLILQNNGYSDENRDLLSELFKTEQYVNSVLTYAKMSSETTDFLFKKYDIDSIVKVSIKKFSAQFIRKKLKLNFTPLNISAVTDEKWLSFVFEQILSNALKYTNSGEISIYPQNKNSVVIKDTGIGISPEDLPRIFDNGFTGYNGRSDKKATGIGLYLCKKILTKLSHDITVESEPNAGTKVIITFNKDNVHPND